MNIYLEMTEKELKSCFNTTQDDVRHILMNRSFDIKIGEETFSCITNHIRWGTQEDWFAQEQFKIEAYGKSKREQEIMEATALVNKTKQEYKEAQRKLSELNGSKTK